MTMFCSILTISLKCNLYNHYSGLCTKWLYAYQYTVFVKYIHFIDLNNLLQETFSSKSYSLKTKLASEC